jgi:type II secretory pathway predicted ATPase ExeA
VDKLFESIDVKELDSRLRYMLDNRGICLIVGEPGTGKSTSLRRFAENLNKSLYRACYLPLTTLTVRDFYHALTMMLGETPRSRKVDLYKQIQTCIETLYFDQRILPVIIIDEVHMAPVSILDDLRIIFNFKMDSANPFVLILSGQPLIRNKLALNSSYPLRQRITTKYSMQGLSSGETSDYCKSRITIAGGDPGIFTNAAIDAIHSASGGFPRSINNIATGSMLYAAGKKMDQIDEEAVYQANLDSSL